MLRFYPCSFLPFGCTCSCGAGKARRITRFFTPFPRVTTARQFSERRYEADYADRQRGEAGHASAEHHSQISPQNYTPQGYSPHAFNGAAGYRQHGNWRGRGGYVKTYGGRGRNYARHQPHRPQLGASVAFQSYEPVSRNNSNAIQCESDAATNAATPSAHVPSKFHDTAAAEAAAAAMQAEAGGLCRSFWSQTVRHVPAGELKHQHMLERAHDKRSRFLVRNRIREDGVLSNLFPITFHDDATVQSLGVKPDAYLYIYEMYVTRLVPPKAGTQRDRPASSSAAQPALKTRSTEKCLTAVEGSLPTERRVAPGRSWRAIQRYLRYRFHAAAATLLPPLIQLENKIYAAAPLPADALQLPKTYFDIGWKVAELRLLSRSRYADLPASVLQTVVNKIVLEIARATQQQHQHRQKQHASNNNNNRSSSQNADDDASALGVLEVVREKTGKLACTMQGVSSGGLRLYRGIYVNAIFVDHTAALLYEPDHDSDDAPAAAGAESQHTAAGEKTGKRIQPNNNVDGGGGGGGGGGRNYVSCDAVTAAKTMTTTPARLAAPSTRHLTETPVGLTSADNPIHFRVDVFLRAFTYRGTPVESYQISDASGSVLASVWAPPQPQALAVGAVYSAAPVRIREFAERGNARLVELPRGTVPVLLAAPATAPSSSSSSPTVASAVQPHTQRAQLQCGGRRVAALPDVSSSPPPRLPGHISLKIDTKGTIASEISLWGEVLQHFGPGPYDEATQQRIQKALVHMPVVISYSLQQGVVREVLFDGGALLASSAAAATTTDPQRSSMARELAAQASAASASEAACAAEFASGTEVSIVLPQTSPTPLLGVREPRLLPLLPFLDAQQPCAVLTNYSILPLQVLHCCFDPTMKGWQDICVAVLSLMPNQRMELLNFVQQLLSKGLQRWGIEVASRPWRTKSLSLLPAPMKYVVPKAGEGATRPQLSPHTLSSAAAVAAASAFGAARVYPSTIAVIGISGPRCTAEQSQRVSLTVQHTAKYFHTSLVACVEDESAGVQFVHDQLMLSATPPTTSHDIAQQQQRGAYSSSDGGGPMTATLRDINSAVFLVTNEPDTRATRWLKVECMSRGIHLITLPPSSSPKRLNVYCGSLRRQLATQFELDPLRGVDLRSEVPVLGRRRVLFIGVDTCHTNTRSVGTIVGILSTPASNHLLSHFWQHDARGRETSHIAEHFKNLLEKAVALHGGVDEVVVFQDGDVFSELAGVKEELAAQLPGCGLTFMCLHKRCNIRFTHTSSNPSTSAGGRWRRNSEEEENNGRELSRASVEAGFHNVVKGVVITGLAPVPLDYEVAASSFYLQTHESAMSTARAVQYTVHHVSPTLDVADVQQMANVMANVMAPQATKLPMSTRCAHRLADRAERLLDAVPQFTGEMIPRPLSNRLWFL